MEREIYRNLAEHLDRLPDGFPPSETGAELRLLERLFTLEEAALAVYLRMDKEEDSVIAERAGLPQEETAQRLREMSKKGLIFSIQKEDGTHLYQAAPWIIGIYEFQVNNLSPEYIQDLENYWRTIKSRPGHKTIPQMRVIPVAESIDVRRETLTYEQVDELIKAHTHYAVAPCICRRMEKSSGRGCEAPEESCLVFGEFADYYVQNGMARPIDLPEVKQILAMANAANLVLQPSNSRSSLFICCCCGCCCGILGGLKRQRKPAEAVSSPFIARFEPDLCAGCMVCLDRCQMEALTEAGDIVALNSDRCIGCGLCVSTCPTGALNLVRKPESAHKPVPAIMDDTWRIIMQAQSRQEQPRPEQKL